MKILPQSGVITSLVKEHNSSLFDTDYVYQYNGIITSYNTHHKIYLSTCLYVVYAMYTIYNLQSVQDRYDSETDTFIVANNMWKLNHISQVMK